MGQTQNQPTTLCWVRLPPPAMDFERKHSVSQLQPLPPVHGHSHSLPISLNAGNNASARSEKFDWHKRAKENANTPLKNGRVKFVDPPSINEFNMNDPRSFRLVISKNNQFIPSDPSKSFSKLIQPIQFIVYWLFNNLSQMFLIYKIPQINQNAFWLIPSRRKFVYLL